DLVAELRHGVAAVAGRLGMTRGLQVGPRLRVFRGLPRRLHPDVTVAAVRLLVADREVAEEPVRRILALNERPRHVLDLLGRTAAEPEHRNDDCTNCTRSPHDSTPQS